MEAPRRDTYFAGAHLSRSTGGTRPQEDSYERNNAPGTSFGVIKGIKGYWRRPKRKLGKVLKKLTLLLRVQPEARYKPRFDYNGVIDKAFSQNAAQTDFARNLEKEIAFRIEKASSGSSTSKSSSSAGFRRPSWYKP